MQRHSFTALGLASLVLLAGCGDDSSTSPAPAAPQGTNGLTVLSPNGGETFQVGGAIPVEWSYTNADFSSARILLGCEADQWFDLTASSVDPDLLDTVLAIPDSVYSSAQRKKIVFPSGNSCRLKIQDYTIATIADASDAVFTVKAR